VQAEFPERHGPFRERASKIWGSVARRLRYYRDAHLVLCLIRRYAAAARTLEVPLAVPGRPIKWNRLDGPHTVQDVPSACYRAPNNPCNRRLHLLVANFKGGRF
jgi:hypothetical protein